MCPCSFFLWVALVALLACLNLTLTIFDVAVLLFEAALIVSLRWGAYAASLALDLLRFGPRAVWLGPEVAS